MTLGPESVSIWPFFARALTRNPCTFLYIPRGFLLLGLCCRLVPMRLRQITTDGGNDENGH